MIIETVQMKKEVLFIHSAGPQGYHEGSDYLVTYLTNRLSNYKVLHPKMPDPEHPTYQSWKDMLMEEMANLEEGTILIGHSLGASVLLKYLAEEKRQKTVSGLFLIGAVYWGKEDWDVEEYVLPENFSSRLSDIPEIFFYHSKDDEVVPITHTRCFAKALPTAHVREFEKLGHLFGKGLPELVEDIKSI